MFLATPADIAIYGGAAGGGKALDVDTPILTTSGWSSMGDLSSGDYVYGTDGRPTKVLQAHEPYFAVKVYDVEFDCGERITADATHLWHTFTEKDRAADYRRDPEVRARRRAKRKSRGTGKRPDLSRRNAAQGLSHVPSIVTGSVKTTEEIRSTLLSKRGALNHSIAVPAAVHGRQWSCNINPYLVGYWLGDGHSREGVLTIAEPEQVAIIKAIEPGMYKNKQQYAYRVPALTARLRACGLLNNKHVPDWILTADVDSKLEVLRGLMDSDGSAMRNGRLEFSVVNRDLAFGVRALIASLGLKPSMTKSPAMLYNKNCGTRYRINFRAPFRVFRLERKAQRQNLNVRPTTRRHFIKAVERVEPRLVRCITVDASNKLFLAGSCLIPTHNSWALLLECLRYTYLPTFHGILFRRTYPQIMNPGGLWSTSQDIFPSVQARGLVTKLMWEFPSGATISFKHMQYEADKIQYQGAQIPFIGWDELTHFTEGQFFYMLSRLRSMSGVRGYVRATCNPDADSWVAEFIDWWIADDGYADLSKAGKLRWLLRRGDVKKWYDTKREALEDNPEADEGDPKSVTFIPASVYDNKALLQKDPAYLSNLKALGSVERERLLGDAERGGNWHIKAGGTLFKREWFQIIPQAPEKMMGVCRFWDKAATEPAPGKNPDWTVGAKVGFKDGQWFILDVHRFQKSSFHVEQLIKQDAIMDGFECQIRMEEEGGSAGKDNISSYARNVLPGFDFDGIRSTGSKTVRAQPLARAAEAGNVFLVQGEWNKDFLDEAESFSETCEHDDQIDGVDGALNHLAKQFLDPGFTGAAPSTANVEKWNSQILAAYESITDPKEKAEAFEKLREAGLI